MGCAWQFLSHFPFVQSSFFVFSRSHNSFKECRPLNCESGPHRALMSEVMSMQHCSLVSVLLKGTGTDREEAVHSNSQS